MTLTNVLPSIKYFGVGIVVALAFSTAAALAAPQIGKPAPEFTGTDTKG